MGIVGVFTEIIVLIELVICAIVDWVFWGVIEKSNELLNDASVVNEGALE